MNSVTHARIFQDPPSGRKNERGTVLIVTMVVLVTLTILLASLLGAVHSRQQVGDVSDNNVARFYAAEMGLSRVKLMVTQAAYTNSDPYCNWMADYSGTGTNAKFASENKPAAMKPALFDNGASYFDIGDDLSGKYRVRAFCLNPNIVTTGAADKLLQQWYVVVVRANHLNSDGTDDTAKPSTSLCSVARPHDFLSRYARLVCASNDLSIGDNVSYIGEVHGNKNITMSGTGIRFYARTTCTGSFNGTYYDSTNTKGGKYQLFYQDYASGVTAQDLSSAISGIASNPPSGATLYKADDATFKATAYAKTGYYPKTGTNVNVTITFSNTKMNTTVSFTNTAGVAKSYTTTSESIPDGTLVYVTGSVSCSGSIASRLTLVTASVASVASDIVYTNASGTPQYGLYSVAADGTETSVGTGVTSSWATSSYDYREVDGWTQPTDTSGESYNPMFGLIAKSKIYLANSNGANRQVHGFLCCTGGTIDAATSSGTGKNLYTLGGLISTGTNSLSGAWSYRQYTYDTNGYDTPPPFFVSTTTPCFKNWHVVDTDQVTAYTNSSNTGTWKLTSSYIYNTFKTQAGW